MSHRRSKESQLVAISELKVDPNFQHDDRYLRLIIKAARGEIGVSLTRLSIETIHSGFYRRSGSKTEHVTNLKDRDRIAGMALMLRTGWRPAIELYWNPLAPGGGGYVCPDDELTLEAYRSLKIRYVPCRILSPKVRRREEGAIWIGRIDDGTGLIREVAPLRPDQFPAFKMSKKRSLHGVCELLTAACKRVRHAIREFHRGGSNDELHYHQMLHAAVSRHERILESIEILASNDRVEHASAFARVCYEAFLNFYVDWLSPEFFGPRLQLLAFVRENRLSDREIIPLKNFPEFLENSGRKGRISPLGERYHEVIYPSLSLIAHQSYAYLEREASSFSADVPNASKDAERKLAVWLNVLTVAFLSRVANDVALDLNVTPH